MKLRRRKWISVLEFISIATLLSLCILFVHLVHNSQDIGDQTTILRSTSEDFADFEAGKYRELVSKLRARAETYIALIESDQLLDDMVITRGVDGSHHDVCDSLLFSSLYFISLNKLGYEDLATKVWRAIESSRTDRGWVRHPRCHSPPPSRDMMIGLVSALTQRPDGYREILGQLIDQIGHENGYFGDGSIFVSYISPGVAEYLRQFARIEGHRNKELPNHLRKGFSTIEWSVAFTERGYRSHLHALSIWLELELESLIEAQSRRTRSVTNTIANWTNPFTPDRIYNQRLQYVAEELVSKDRKNLFFRYLRHTTAGAFTPKTAAPMMAELLNLSQFPEDRLPNNCDRKADYLWQRDSREYQTIDRHCSRVFSGVDFLWMAALLLEAPH
jgi:hypothetical protein